MIELGRRAWAMLGIILAAAIAVLVLCVGGTILVMGGICLAHAIPGGLHCQLAVEP